MSNTYQITNTGGTTWTSTSLTLASGATTTMNVPTTLPIDLDPGIVSGQLVAFKLGAGGGGGGGDVNPETNVAETSVNASLTSQILSAAVSTGLLAPGRQVFNNTADDIAINCANGAAASWAANHDIIPPGESTYVSADYLDAITVICRSAATGTVILRTFF